MQAPYWTLALAHTSRRCFTETELVEVLTAAFDVTNGNSDTKNGDTVALTCMRIVVKQNCIL